MNNLFEIASKIRQNILNDGKFKAVSNISYNEDAAGFDAYGVDGETIHITVARVRR